MESHFAFATARIYRNVEGRKSAARAWPPLNVSGSLISLSQVS